MTMTVEQARALMREWTQSAALRVHMEAVAACMGAYADRLEPGERDRWVVAGLLHDMDYERHPSQEAGHPFVAVEHLRSIGVDEEILAAILGHADYTGTPRTTPMATSMSRTLPAVLRVWRIMRRSRSAACGSKPHPSTPIRISSLRRVPRRVCTRFSRARPDASLRRSFSA